MLILVEVSRLTVEPRGVGEAGVVPHLVQVVAAEVEAEPHPEVAAVEAVVVAHHSEVVAVEAGVVEVQHPEVMVGAEVEVQVLP